MTVSMQRNGLVLLCLVAALGICVAISAAGWVEIWTWLGVPAKFPPAFADMRSVQGGLLSALQGFDPQIENPADPWGRPMNYPVIWLSIAGTFDFYTEQHFLIFIGAMIIAYFGCCLFLVWRTGSYWIALALFSGASLLAVERGNNDLAIFVLMMIAAFVPRFVGIALMALATLLKVFPVLAVLGFIRERVIFALACLAGLAALVFMWGELQNIQSGTPVGAGMSYGSASISGAALDKAGIVINPYLISGLLLVSAAALWSGRLPLPKLQLPQMDETIERLFLIGGAIYLGTFLLVANYDYRLIFLIFCMPCFIAIEGRFWRLSILVAVILASNQWAMYSILGFVGAGINILAKCFVFVTLASLYLDKVLLIIDKDGMVRRKLAL